MTQEKPINTEEELILTLNRVKIKKNSVINFNWRWNHEPVGDLGWFVWCEFERPDIITKDKGWGRGRKEFVAKGTMFSGVCKTCWLCYELVVKHELMEAFTVDGNRVFNPHHEIGELMQVCQKRKVERDMTRIELGSKKIANADKAYAEYDFGDNVVKGDDGWNMLAPLDWTKVVHFENGDKPSKRSVFGIRFNEQGEVIDAFCLSPN